MVFKELSQAARGRIKIVELQCAADLQKKLEGTWTYLRNNKSSQYRLLPNSNENLFYNPIWEYTRAFVNQIAQEYFAAVDGPEFVTILTNELLPKILQSVTGAWRKAVDNSLDATGFTFAIIKGMPSWNREGVQAIDFTTRLRAALQPAVNEWERRAEDRLIQRQTVRPADTSESGVTPDDSQNQHPEPSSILGIRFRTGNDELGTPAPPVAPPFAQPPDPTGTFSGPNPESSWPESETAESRSADNLTVLMDAVSAYGPGPELGLLPDWRVLEIESRAHFERVLQSPGGPLSLLRRCMLGLHRALFETHPRLSNLNVEQFWSSREVRILFEQFLSRRFGESWSGEETVSRAYIALKAWLYGYIADVRRATPGQNESEHRSGTMADSPEGSDQPKPEDPARGDTFPVDHPLRRCWDALPPSVREFLGRMGLETRLEVVQLYGGFCEQFTEGEPDFKRLEKFCIEWFDLLGGKLLVTSLSTDPGTINPLYAGYLDKGEERCREFLSEALKEIATGLRTEITSRIMFAISNRKLHWIGEALKNQLERHPAPLLSNVLQDLQRKPPAAGSTNRGQPPGRSDIGTAPDADPSCLRDLNLKTETPWASFPGVGTTSAEPTRPGLNEGEASAPECAHPQDPVQDNPFPPAHPLHQAWVDATHKAEHELLRFKHKLEEMRADVVQEFEKRVPQFQQELLAGRIEAYEIIRAQFYKWWQNWNVLYLVGIFHIWAERALSGVWNYKSARYHEEWLKSYANSMQEAAKNAPLEGAGLDSQPFVQELQFQLSRECVYGSLQARERVAAIDERIAQHAQQESGHDSGQSAQPPLDQNIHAGPVPAQDAHVALLEMILTKGPTTLEKWASAHRIGRTTVFDWKSLRSAGKSLHGKVSVEKTASIEEAIETDARALGLDTRTNSD